MLWDPAIIFQSAGLQYVKSVMRGTVSFRCGLAWKQTKAHSNTLLTDDYRTASVERYRSDTGVEIVGDAAWMIDSSTTYLGSAELLTTFKHPDIWAIRWENELRVNIWKFIGVTLQLRMVYDQSQVARLQYKQGAMISLSVVPF